jgi:hypothetical protein
MSHECHLRGHGTALADRLWESRWLSRPAGCRHRIRLWSTRRAVVLPVARRGAGFPVSVAPSSASVSPGGGSSNTVSVAAVNGFSGGERIDHPHRIGHAHGYPAS